MIGVHAEREPDPRDDERQAGEERPDLEDRLERIGDELQEEWHRAKEVARFIRRNGRRAAVAVAGFAVVAAGIVLSLPLVPGPGIVLILAGLAILATEFAWARRALERAREKARHASRRLGGRRGWPGERPGAAEGDPAGEGSDPP